MDILLVCLSFINWRDRENFNFNLNLESCLRDQNEYRVARINPQHLDKPQEMPKYYPNIIQI